MRCADTNRDAVPKRWIRLLLPILLFVSAVGITACGSKGTSTPAASQPASASEPAQSLPPAESATAQAQRMPLASTEAGYDGVCWTRQE